MQDFCKLFLKFFVIFLLKFYCQDLTLLNNLFSGDINIIYIIRFNCINQVRQHIFLRLEMNFPLWLNDQKICLLADFQTSYLIFHSKGLSPFDCQYLESCFDWKLAGIPTFHLLKKSCSPSFLKHI
ncbi:Uncharacterised protein [Streptococcus pneumoniae]|nr:Uncharacterised protein [Streptococcus pneumoniae]CEY62649.1 Uncharacterised protein [Streptococcus pneumoniae]CIS43912.1 Uncharacterised protein [Streptococcus pneumoniae]CIZ28922.1 Uncharacterised protein [Streptococcus pneumoniae]CJF20295.1 Uncharacterised protein [Streptococcus pneumoniae]